MPLGTDPAIFETKVRPGEAFYVDIWGCADADACASDGVIARGCTEVMTASADDTAVGVNLEDAVLGDCPPTTEGAPMAEIDESVPPVSILLDTSRLP